MKMIWEKIESEGWLTGGELWRAKVPGGWLIMLFTIQGVTFYPDPKHEWDGNSLP
jgi:hypothetical protein